MTSSLPNQNLTDLVALFLAEAVRSRRTSLPRAAEISRRVVERLHQLESEAQALYLLTEIEKDFEEISQLKQAISIGQKISDARIYEPEIKDFAARVFKSDLETFNGFLQQAAQPGMTIQQLCLKYPPFCEYLLSTRQKTA